MKKPKTETYIGKRVLLIDAGSRQVLPMIKGFRQLGCEVSVYSGSALDVGRHYKYTSKVIKGVYDQENEDGTYAGILQALRTGTFDLVVPMNDFAAGILAKNKAILSEYAVIYVNDPDTYALACDKLSTMRICMENNIPCPKTALITDLSQFDDTHWQYPLVIKPRSSYGANGFNLAENRQELETNFALTEQKFGPSLIQEYIPQTDKQYQVEMLMDDAGECKTIVIMDKLRWYPINGGSSTINVTIHDAQIKDACISLLKAIGWKGYASLDLIRDPRDGVAKILEINPRINGTAKICFAAGVDLAKMLLQDAFGDSVESADAEDGVYLRYFHMDVLWFLKSENRFHTEPSWFSWKNTVDEIFSCEDLRPAFFYSISAIGKLFHDKKKRGI